MCVIIVNTYLKIEPVRVAAVEGFGEERSIRELRKKKGEAR